MSSDNRDNNSSFAVSRRQALGLLGGASVLTLLGASPVFAGDGGGGGEGDHEVSLHTRLVHDYGIRYPIVSAGMAFVGLPELVVAVSNAGGLGVYGAAPELPPVWICPRAQRACSKPSGFSLPPRSSRRSSPKPAASSIRQGGPVVEIVF